MKKSVKKNQVIIAALTMLLCIAGYINFSGNTIGLSDGEKEGMKETESAFAETDLEANAGEITIEEMEDGENIELNSDEEDIGEAVLTSTTTSSTSMVNMKLNREQVRSKN
ncbi:MAG: SpoIIIAH-like family protein, partial [Lachnospiraceae bacterium]|nr:SpoIIIAH-like family protein [Lachnospiraceae bacterium]